MSEEETIEFFLGWRFNMSSDRGDKSIIVTAQSLKEVGNKLRRGKRGVSSTHGVGEVFDLLKVLKDRGRSFCKSGELIPKLDDSGLGVRSKKLIKGRPGFFKGRITNNLSYEIVGEGRNKSTQNTLVNLGPVEIVRVAGGGIGEKRSRGAGAIKDMKSTLAFEVGNHLSTLEKKIIIGKFN